MNRKVVTSMIAIVLTTSVAFPVAAQNTGGKANASTSAGATNSDVMAPGATGATSPNGAGDTSASAVSNSGQTQHKAKHRKSKAKKPASDAATGQQ